jgi:septal ring factor EnvC (AmiA/AmiB activator)
MTNNSDREASSSLNLKLLGAVSVIAYGLGMFWMQNMWRSLEDERAAREALSLSIAKTYVTMPAFSSTMEARDVTRQTIIDRIERNTDRLIGGEQERHVLRELVAKLEADHSRLTAIVEEMQKEEAKEHQIPFGRQR